MMQALAELTVLYPINGAFCMYICRFVDPSLGFACAWEYAISWLTVLPFEISAACNIVSDMDKRGLGYPWVNTTCRSTFGQALKASTMPLGSFPCSSCLLSFNFSVLRDTARYDH